MPLFRTDPFLKWYCPRNFQRIINQVCFDARMDNSNRSACSVKHRGFGFVEFEEAEDAKHAMENMRDSELFGRVLTVNIAKPDALKKQAGTSHVSCCAIVWHNADQ